MSDIQSDNIVIAVGMASAAPLVEHAKVQRLEMEASTLSPVRLSPNTRGGSR